MLLVYLPAICSGVPIRPMDVVSLRTSEVVSAHLAPRFDGLDNIVRHAGGRLRSCCCDNNAALRSMMRYE
jgi:hypothetical protein